jgi:hypothetical protein
VPRTHQYVVTLMVHTNPIKPATTPGPHIGNLNEEQARRGRHPERRSTQGDVRDVVVIGERFHDNTGEVVGTQGFYLDVTPSAKQRQESISVALAEIADHRAAIEQAKGVLMYVYGIGPDAAFDILKWRSQDANIKLRALAEQLVAHIHTLKHDDGSPLSRPTFDQLLLTAHEGVKARGASAAPRGAL